MVGVVRRRHVLAERHELRLVGHVGDERRHHDPFRGTLLGQQHGLGHVRRRDVADGDAAALGGQLTRQLAPHPRPAAGDDGDLACEGVHRRILVGVPSGRCSPRTLSRAAALLGGDAAWPAVDGEPVFDEPWQGRAFAMAFELVDRSGLSWDAFREQLVAAIADDPGRPYYESWLVALERLAVATGAVDHDAVARARNHAASYRYHDEVLGDVEVFPFGQTHRTLMPSCTECGSTARPGRGGCGCSTATTCSSTFRCRTRHARTAGTNCADSSSTSVPTPPTAYASAPEHPPHEAGADHRVAETSAASSSSDIDSVPGGRAGSTR